MPSVNLSVPAEEVLGHLQSSDIDLVRAARQKGANAFAALVRNYQNFVYRTAYGVLQNKSDAEDVTQETFIKVYQSLQGLRDERTFPTWIARITVRTALDFLGRRERQQTLSLDPERIQGSSDPHEATHHRMDLENALGQMDADSRTILVLRELHGFDYEALANVLDIPTGTVRSRLHRARAQLRQLLSDERGSSL